MESKATRRQIQERARQMIESHFPSEAGWEFNYENRWREYRVDFVVERREGTRRFRNVFKIAYSCSPLYRVARTLNLAARKMAGRYVKIMDKILIAPLENEYDQGDASIIIWRIEDLRCKDQKLYWSSTS